MQHETQNGTATLPLGQHESQRQPAADQRSQRALSLCADDALLWRLEELAMRLSVSLRTAKRIVAARLVRVVKIGRATRVDRRSVEQWVARGCPMHGPRQRVTRREHAAGDEDSQPSARPQSPQIDNEA